MSKESSIAYILHARAFKETSLLLHLFSQKNGRFTVVAKGVKRKGSQAQRAILQPFNLLTVEYFGRGDMKTLSDVELISGLAPLPTRALACGYYLNELLLRSLQEWQEFESLFQSYQLAVNHLHSCSDFSPTLREFEVSLLDELGIAPSWDMDIMGVEISKTSRYYFVPEQGFQPVSIRSNDNDELTKHSLQIEGTSLNGEAILSLGSKQFKTELNKSCQQITQRLLRQVIGNRPLESRKLWL